MEAELNSLPAVKIEISMMGGFTVMVDGRRVEQAISRQYKGVLLMQMLMVHHRETVSNQRLYQALWPDEEKHANPESALKTLVSRMRNQIKAISPVLAMCIVTERGGYRWECCPGVTVDVVEIDELLDEMDRITPAEALERRLYKRLTDLYRGELLHGQAGSTLVHGQAAYLHSRYLDAVHRCMGELSNRGRYEDVMNICKQVIAVEKLNEQVYIELMKAMVRLGRVNEAVTHYRYVERLFYKYLGIRPSEEMQAFYKSLSTSGNKHGVDLAAICEELEEEFPRPGAYVCDYVVFKEGYKIMMRNIDRTMCDVSLAALAVHRADGAAMDYEELDRCMLGLINTLRETLRKGDMLSRYATDVAVVLLPVTRLETAQKLIDQAQMTFYRRFPNAGWVVDAHVERMNGKPASGIDVQRLPENEIRQM